MKRNVSNKISAYNKSNAYNKRSTSNKRKQVRLNGVRLMMGRSLTVPETDTQPKQYLSLCKTKQFRLETFSCHLTLITVVCNFFDKKFFAQIFSLPKS